MIDFNIFFWLLILVFTLSLIFELNTYLIEPELPQLLVTWIIVGWGHFAAYCLNPGLGHSGKSDYTSYERGQLKKKKAFEYISENCKIYIPDLHSLYKNIY